MCCGAKWKFTKEATPKHGEAPLACLDHLHVFFSFLILLEEMRSEITEDACMCEAQIVFQKKVHSAIQELSRKHILSESYTLNGLRLEFV